jgi:hypothetical protein
MECQVCILSRGPRFVRATLKPSFDSRLPATEDTVLDKTDPTEKAEAKAFLQNAIAMDDMVQCMSEMDDFHRVLLSMKEDADWPTRKARKTWQSIKNHYQPTGTTTSRDLKLALQSIKLRRDVDLMKIMSQLSAVEVKFKQTPSKEKKVEVVQGCTGDNYIVVTDKVSRIESERNATALELCEAMKQAWRIKGHNEDDEEVNDVNNDSVGLETSLGTVKDKQSLVGKQRCYECKKTGHRSVKRPNKKKKGQTEKAGAVTDASVKKTKSKCSHCGKPGHKEEDCWKKYPHKAPPRRSTEASGTFLNEELLMCHIAQDEMPYITQGIEEAYYCVPTIEDGRWDDLNNWMGLVDSIANQEGPLMADLCSEEQMTSNNEKIDDVGMND